MHQATAQVFLRWLLVTMVHPNSKSVAKTTQAFLAENVPIFDAYTTSYEVYRDAPEVAGSVAGVATVAGRKASRDYLVLLHELKTWLNGN